MTWIPAITLSRTFGSGGTLIAYHVAQRLGWRYCDRAILRQAAAALGMGADDLAAQEECPNRLWQNILRLLGAGSPEAPYSPPLELPVYSLDLFRQECAVMAGVLQREAAVLVGRGGFVAFRDRPATLHVHVQADMAFRTRRLVEMGRAADAKEALNLARQSDRDRAAFIKAISGREWMAPGNFQLVVDPSRDGFPACEQAIAAAAPGAE
jgi:cytidylate kinase